MFRRQVAGWSVRAPRLTPWTWLRSMYNLTPRNLDGWNDLTRRLRPPEGVLERFAHRHSEVPPDRVKLVWEAFGQWVRIRGRDEARLCQPSLAVDDLWRQLVDDGAVWQQLPRQVQAMMRIPVRDHGDRNRLDETYAQAHWDEYKTRPPVLFLVDEALSIADARLYRAECTVGNCKELSARGEAPERGRTCLHGILWMPAIRVGGAAP